MDHPSHSYGSAGTNKHESVFGLLRSSQVTRHASLLLVALTLATFLINQSAFATTINWNNTNTDFNSTGSWTGGAVPGTGDVAQFNTTKVNDPNLSASLTIQGLSFAAVSGYTLTNSNSAALTLTNEGTSDTVATSAIRASNTTGTNTVSASLILGGATSSTQSFSQAAGGALLISGTISNTNSLTLRLGGGGIIDLSGNNSSLSASLSLATNTTLQIGSNTALGTGTLTVSGSGTTIQSDSSTARVLSNAITLSTTTTTFGTGGDLTFGAMTLSGGNRTVVVNNGVTTVSSIAPDATTTRQLTKQGTGALVVTGNKTNTGTTSIDAGTLAVGGTFSSGNVTLNGGILALNGSFTRSLGTGGTAVQWTNSGGFAAYGTNATWGNSANNLTVNIGSGTALTWASTGSFLANGQTLILGSFISNGTVDFQNAIDLNSAERTVQVNRSTVSGAGTDAKLSGAITSATGSLKKTGTGILELTGNSNTFGGGTIVDAGTLLVTNSSSSASATGSGAVTVNSSGTLGGTGYIIAGSNNVTINGTLSPGSSAGTIHISAGALTLNSGSTTMFDLGTASDLIALSGTTTLTVGGTLSLSLGAGFSYANTYTLVNGITGTASGTFASVTGYDSVNYMANVFQSGSEYDISFTAVPEPGTWIAGGLAVFGLVFTQRKRIVRMVARA